ncbi:substrate-binding domain-containing protein [Wenxinia saemankumensis]|uniref:Phosphate ABC transporter substrate-binding protein, PhoT family n=1 Tax=Wenxinia saemankumensis TaxID=1447782 RepID=A0A1M6FTG0_9RHOB|nr:substrate-binding domain-containing protein [Wenxinia saemankumensis]SHJ00933.1 phosphate ABC transporter substrate-binding protein, PhoT family [Wenxinia saemankumensis]
MTSRLFGRPLAAWTGAAIFAALLFCASALTAQPVSLRLGGMELSGEAVGYDGTYLRVMTPGGEVTIDLRGADCEGPGCPGADWIATLRLSGTPRLGEVILPALVEGYARSRGFSADRTEGAEGAVYTLRDAETGAGFLSVAFTVKPTEEGFEDLLARRADGVMAARVPTAAEVAAAEAAGLGALDGPGRVRVLALDGLVPVVAPGQAARRLTLAQLAGILGGTIRRWEELGGTGPITLHLAAENAGQVEGIARRLGVGMVAAAVSHDGVDSVSAAVAADPGGLALVPLGETGFAVPLALEGACGIVMAPRPGAIRTEDYPLSTPLMLFLPERRQAVPIRDFLAWLPSPEAQLVLRRAGVLGLSAVPIPLAEQGERLAAAIAAAGEGTSLADLQDMVGFLRDKTRLSPTFRFEEGQIALDPVSRSQFLALVAAIREGEHAGRALWLVGFSDGLGSAPRNVALSEARAEALAASILAALGGEIPEGTGLNVAAFGEALPLACDDTALGRALNRRVELWAGPPG